MSLWSSIKNIGKKVINGVSGFFTGQPIFNNNNGTYSTGTSSTNWLQSFSNIIGQATPYLMGAMGLDTKANEEAQRRQYEYNLKLQQNQQQWSEQLSSTAHQREVNDLRNAGLNPLLSSVGNGASTPTSGMGTVGLTDDGQQRIAAISNALQYKQLKLTEKNLNSEIERRNAEIANISEDTNQKLIQNKYLPNRLKNEIIKLRGEIALNKNIAAAKMSQLDLMKAQKIETLSRAELNNRLPVRNFGKSKTKDYGGLGFHWRETDSYNENYLYNY